ncbi:response regulator [Lyngbya aestuarii]|uniref:response regulator n=1 Tax=Lyngbya aestuarii TaxID=118322 RepID=UPI00403DD2BB
MTKEPTIREQGYNCFLQEAPELLQALEQDLLSLRENHSLNKVHNLMRITHTLKGAAASVGLETIKSVAHSLEDIFKALCQPDLLIDSEVEALLFEGYECLHLPLTAEFTGGQVNEAEVLDRTAAIFAQLQEKLGDCFAQKDHLPSSAELGFDVTQSIFEIGVTKRLQEIATALNHGNMQEIINALQVQAEVLLGLAESLNLPGFGAIAQTALTALDNQPEQAETIARQALEDFLEGQAAVLEGDRSQGGYPSEALQQLAGITLKTTDAVIEPTEFPAENFDGESQQEESSNELLESIWGVDRENSAQEINELPLSFSNQAAEEKEEFVLTGMVEETPDLAQEETQEFFFSKQIGNGFASARRNQQPRTTSTQPKEVLTNDQSPVPRQEKASPARTVRVNVEHLEHLNYSIGELLTNQNRQSLENEQLRTQVKVLISRLQKHQQLLSQLRDSSDHLFTLPEQWQDSKRWHADKLKLTAPIANFQASTERFDPLELEHYTEAGLLIQSILEDTVQLAEASDAIELFSRQSGQTLGKQTRLLTSARDALIEARMLPLAKIFNRLPRVLEQLEVLHDKSVTLELQGTEVLVEKVVAEKLYDPLLHLVRNAFDHGIESPSHRQQFGKSPQGLISICAYHRGSYLVIEVKDDGQGLDFEQIRQRAVETQLLDIEQSHALDETQLKDLLFEPGFSTVSEVNELSGRGIGLDVVRTQIQTLNGSVTVDAEIDQGTRFILQIPLSLTIAKLLVFQAGDSSTGTGGGNRIYALLAEAIEQIIIPKPSQLQCWSDGKALRWGKGADQQLIPVYQLATFLNYYSPVPETLGTRKLQSFVPQESVNPILIIRCQGQLMGLEVNQLVGDQELVVRPLGGMITPPSFVYGGSILADGRLTLVLDGEALLQYLSDQQANDSTESSSISRLDGENSSVATNRLNSSSLYYTNAYREAQTTTPTVLSSSQEHKQLPAATGGSWRSRVEGDFRFKPERVVLLVDDSITVRQTLAMTLQQAGYQVLQAKDGYEAIEQIQLHSEIDLVICDIEMPRLNGFEFLKYRQEDATLAQIPVLMLTSRSGDKHRLLAQELGATDYITKPYLEHKLLTMLTELLENTRNQ